MEIFPFSPKDEQKRIVNNVNEPMKLGTFGSDPNISLLLFNLRSEICKNPGLEAPFGV